MKPYVIKQGDYLKKLAHRRGFVADEVWSDPKNAELKAKRKDPNQLVAGDVLYIPDDPPKKLPFVAKSDNQYVADVPKVKVKVALKVAGTVLKQEPYVVKGIGHDDEEKKTDDDGNVEVEAPVHVREFVIYLPKRKQSCNLLIGGLDPIDVPSGVRMRLTHLGFYGAPPADGSAGRDENRLAAAIAAFQSANGIEATGEADEATQAALAQAHGS